MCNECQPAGLRSAIFVGAIGYSLFKIAFRCKCECKPEWFKKSLANFTNFKTDVMSVVICSKCKHRLIVPIPLEVFSEQ